jgi:hypothetical protein
MRCSRPSTRLLAMIRPGACILSLALALTGCEDDGGITGTSPTVTGTVTSAATGAPVAGAEVSIGEATTTTGVDGRFELSDLTPGTATLLCTAAGFEELETAVTVTDGSVARDIGLVRIEMFEFGDFALYVPAGVGPVKGVLLALGGPDTRAFATGQAFGAPVPAVEEALQALGLAFRTLASTSGLAVLGTSAAAMANEANSDQLLLDAVETAGELSGRPDLIDAPVLMYGMSGGAPEASGFTVRNPGRVAGLFLKVPLSVSPVTNGDALNVPVYMVLAELDAFVDSTGLVASFVASRGAGALWGLAKELAVPHHSLSPVQRQVTIDWMSTILALRLPVNPSNPLGEIAENSGYLGDRVTGIAAPWVSFTGDRSVSSWLPSQATAAGWETLVATPAARSSGHANQRRTSSR